MNYRQKLRYTVLGAVMMFLEGKTMRNVLIVCLLLVVQGAFAVEIPDPNLRAALEDVFGKAAGDPITADELASLMDLSASNNISSYLNEPHTNISDLTGLQFATNLTELNLEYNKITDISPLVGLTHLTKLNLGVNSISDISPLAGLINLVELNLWHNSIMDISPLADLTNLEWLFLVGNSITNLSPLSDLTHLVHLDLGRNPISDISALSGLTNLERLYLSHSPIFDISPLAGLTNLKGLILWETNIMDILPLAGLTNLKGIRLSNNSISDISPLVANTGLEEGDRVDVRGNPLSAESMHTHIPTLQGRGVQVHFDTPSATTNIFFTPVTAARVGEIFRLNIVSEESLLLSRWSFEIAFMPKILDALEVDSGHAYASCGSTSYSIGIDPTGLIDIEAELSENCPNEAGAALVSVIFEAKAPGTVDFSLLNVVLLDSLGQPVSNIKVQSHEIVVQPSYDLNRDGLVNILDLVLVGQNFGQAHQKADVNGDGLVNILDLIAVAQHLDE